MKPLGELHFKPCACFGWDSCGWFGRAGGEVVDDLGRQEITLNLGATGLAGFGLRSFESGDVFHLRRGDGAVDPFAEQFGVAVVGNRGGHGIYFKRRVWVPATPSMLMVVVLAVIFRQWIIVGCSPTFTVALSQALSVALPMVAR